MIVLDVIVENPFIGTLIMDADAPRLSVVQEPSSATMEAVLGEMRTIRRNGWTMVVFAAVATLVLCSLALGSEKNAANWAFGAIVLGGIAIMGIFGWVRGQHERKAMPILARVFGLDYQKSPKNFYQNLPVNLIPLGGRRSVDDMMSGKVAERAFHFAECKTETGGKNSKTLFRGVVLDLNSRKDLPEFIIALEKETMGSFLSKSRIKVEELPLLHRATGHDGQVYGLWSRPPDANKLEGLRSFMERVIAIGPKELGKSTLYSLVSSGTHFYISLRHGRDLFKIGGLFADDAQIRADMQTAAAEFSHPINLIAEVLRAETALLGSTPA